jgi:hypothetical protein
MKKRTKPVFLLFAMVLSAELAPAQHPKGSLLIVDVENQTIYERDTSDPKLLATNPNPTTAISARNFNQLINIGDIVAVNGTPVKGTLIETVTVVNSQPNPTAGQAIADATRNGLYEWNFEIMTLDGREIGSIRASGTGQGPPPPGATKRILSANHVVLGGTGAFLGVGGYMGGAGAAPPPSGGAPAGLRDASATEDPALRRAHGSGSLRQGIYLLPRFTPEILLQSGSPAAFHADFRPVTLSNPARAAETVVLRMTGLGPTVPGVEPGEPFPTESLQPVNSPVEALVNGVAANVVNAVGWPGAIGEYRVDVQIPSATGRGTASVQVSSAWIQGSQFTIAVE